MKAKPAGLLKKEKTAVKNHRCVSHWKENIFFVLVEPREPGNIGSCARAIKNMGFRNLELVNPAPFLTAEGRCMACNAGDVLENATVYKDFNSAIRNKGIIVAATRRLGRKRGVMYSLREGVKKVAAAAKKNKVAILFGREDKGLSNAEVEETGFLLTIPANPASASLNLAQSVLLTAYELSQGTYKTESTKFITHAERDIFYKRIRSTLSLLEYIPRGNRDIETRIMRNIKHLTERAGFTEWEMKMIFGICSQIEKKLA